MEAIALHFAHSSRRALSGGGNREGSDRTPVHSTTPQGDRVFQFLSDLKGEPH